MEGYLKKGTELKADSGNRYTIIRLLGAGGQGEVYEVECGSSRYALKWYYKNRATIEQKEKIKAIIASESPDPMFLWPQEMIEEGEFFGYIMDLRPEHFCNIADLMKGRVDVSFYHLCVTAYQLSKGYKLLHDKGAVYYDISFGNLFFDPNTGNVLICDNDNITFDAKQRAGVLGTPGFMAPEIVRLEARPSRNTDLYSLSVMLFYLLMVNHPLEGKKESDIVCMDMEARKKLYGTEPVFIFDPENTSNRPVKGIHDNAMIYWELYPAELREMFLHAFTKGLQEPAARVTELEWMHIFSDMMHKLMPCKACGADIFYDEEKEKQGQVHQCWSCGKEVAIPYKLCIGEHMTFLRRGMTISSDQIYGDHDVQKVVGKVVENPKNPRILGIQNLDHTNWIYEKADGSKVLLLPKKTARVTREMKLHFPNGCVLEVL